MGTMSSPWSAVTLSRGTRKSTGEGSATNSVALDGEDSRRTKDCVEEMFMGVSDGRRDSLPGRRDSLPGRRDSLPGRRGSLADNERSAPGRFLRRNSQDQYPGRYMSDTERPMTNSEIRAMSSRTNTPRTITNRAVITVELGVVHPEVTPPTTPDRLVHHSRDSISTMDAESPRRSEPNISPAPEPPGRVWVPKPTSESSHMMGLMDTSRRKTLQKPPAPVPAPVEVSPIETSLPDAGGVRWDSGLQVVNRYTLPSPPASRGFGYNVARRSSEERMNERRGSFDHVYGAFRMAPASSVESRAKRSEQRATGSVQSSQTPTGGSISLGNLTGSGTGGGSGTGTGDGPSGLRSGDRWGMTPSIGEAAIFEDEDQKMGLWDEVAAHNFLLNSILPEGGLPTNVEGAWFTYGFKGSMWRMASKRPWISDPLLSSTSIVGAFSHPVVRYTCLAMVVLYVIGLIITAVLAPSTVLGTYKTFKFTTLENRGGGEVLRAGVEWLGLLGEEGCLLNMNGAVSREQGGSIFLEFDNKTAITGWVLQTSMAAPADDPAKFELSGSNDGVSFELLGAQSWRVFHGHRRLLPDEPHVLPADRGAFVTFDPRPEWPHFAYHWRSAVWTIGCFGAFVLASTSQAYLCKILLMATLLSMALGSFVAAIGFYAMGEKNNDGTGFLLHTCHNILFALCIAYLETWLPEVIASGGAGWLVALGIHNGLYGDTGGMVFVDTWISVALMLFGVAMSLGREVAVDKAQLHVINDREVYKTTWLCYSFPLDDANREAHKKLESMHELVQAVMARCGLDEARQMSVSWGEEEDEDEQLMFPSQLDEEDGQEEDEPGGAGYRRSYDKRMHSAITLDSQRAAHNERRGRREASNNSPSLQRASSSGGRRDRTMESHFKKTFMVDSAMSSGSQLKPTQSLRQLFAQASAARVQMCEKCKEWSLASDGWIRAYNHVLERTEWVKWREMLQDTRLQNDISWVPVKSPDRCIQKVLMSRGKKRDPSLLLDICRSTLAYDSPQGMMDMLERLMADGDITIVRIKSNFDPDPSESDQTTRDWDSGGYRNMVVNLRFNSQEAADFGFASHVCELQITLLAFAKLQNLDSHKRYKAYRNARDWSNLPTIGRLVLETTYKINDMLSCSKRMPEEPPTATSPLGRLTANIAWKRNSPASLTDMEDGRLARRPSIFDQTARHHALKQGQLHLRQDFRFLLECHLRMACGRHRDDAFSNPGSSSNVLWHGVRKTSAMSVCFLTRPLAGFVKSIHRNVLLVYCVYLFISIGWFWAARPAQRFHRFTALATRGGAAPTSPGILAFGPTGGKGCPSPSPFLPGGWNPLRRVEEGPSITVEFEESLSIEGWYFLTTDQVIDSDPVLFELKGSRDGEEYEREGSTLYDTRLWRDLFIPQHFDTPTERVRIVRIPGPFTWHVSLGRLIAPLSLALCMIFALFMGTAGQPYAAERVFLLGLVLDTILTFVAFCGYLYDGRNVEAAHLIVQILPLALMAASVFMRRLFVASLFCAGLVDTIGNIIIDVLLPVGTIIPSGFGLSLVGVSIVLFCMRLWTLKWVTETERRQMECHAQFWREVCSTQDDELKKLKILVEGVKRDQGLTMEQLPAQYNRVRSSGNVGRGGDSFVAAHGVAWDLTVPKTLDLKNPVKSLDQLFTQASFVNFLLLDKIRQWASKCRGLFPVQPPEEEPKRPRRKSSMYENKNGSFYDVPLTDRSHRANSRRLSTEGGRSLPREGPRDGSARPWIPFPKEGSARPPPREGIARPVLREGSPHPLSARGPSREKDLYEGFRQPSGRHNSGRRFWENSGRPMPAGGASRSCDRMDSFEAPAENDKKGVTFVQWDEAERDEDLKKRIKWGGIKSMRRCWEKLARGYGLASVSRLLDVCRQSIVFETVTDLTECLEVISKDPQVNIVRIKNRLDHDYNAQELSWGYRDVNVNIQLNTDETVTLGCETHLCEVQLVLKIYAELKAGGGHKSYVHGRNVRGE